MNKNILKEMGLQLHNGIPKMRFFMGITLVLVVEDVQMDDLSLWTLRELNGPTGIDLRPDTTLLYNNDGEGLTQFKEARVVKSINAITGITSDFSLNWQHVRIHCKSQESRQQLAMELIKGWTMTLGSATDRPSKPIFVGPGTLMALIAKIIAKENST